MEGVSPFGRCSSLGTIQSGCHLLIQLRSYVTALRLSIRLYVHGTPQSLYFALKSDRLSPGPYSSQKALNSGLVPTLIETYIKPTVSRRPRPELLP